MSKKPNTEANKLPMKLRIKAWWEGYDERDIAAKMKQRPQKEEAEEKAVEEPVVEEVPRADPKDELMNDIWNEERVDISQYIWGEGYCGPGGSENIIGMTKLLSLSSKLSMLDIGAGLGGPARILSDHYGVWVQGLESNELLVNKGNELSKMAGLAKKAVIEPYDPENIHDISRNYDRMFAKETMFQIENKDALLAELHKHLKPEGLFLCTDYVLESPAVISSDEYRNWKAGEYRRPFVLDQKEMEETLKKAGFVIRVSEDITQSYVEMISKAWRGAEEVIAKLVDEPNGTRMIDTLLVEAEFWARRSKMLESGKLKLWRFLGYKLEDRKRMMSDW